MLRFKVKGHNNRDYTVAMDETLLTNDSGSLVIDVEITKWDTLANRGTFHYGNCRFMFSFNESELKIIKTKLLLGLAPKLTIAATYHTQW
ncbi:MAG: hypothetical protein [Bacteriophage sp.]|nr:MAG: hypothetical protein [Bacteriophage sp.]